jgi:hypothetical protein
MSVGARTLAIATIVVLAACGDGGRAGTRSQDAATPSSTTAPRHAVGLRFVAAPRRVTALCRRAGQPGGPPVYGGARHPVEFPTYRTLPPRFPIYCPAQLPVGAEAGQNLAKGRTAYQWELSFRSAVSPRRYGVPHAVFGGQEAPFSLLGEPGAAWPAQGMRGALPELRWPLRLQIVTRASVGARPAVVLRFPGTRGSRGGPNGGHLGLVFNIAGRGYFISVHFDRLADRARVRLASSLARWLVQQTPVPARR